MSLNWLLDIWLIILLSLVSSDRILSAIVYMIVCSCWFVVLVVSIFHTWYGFFISSL